MRHYRTSVSWDFTLENCASRLRFLTFSASAFRRVRWLLPQLQLVFIYLFILGWFTIYQLTAAVDEYATGVRIAGKFRHEDYSKINEQFLGMIEDIENVPHRLQSLRKVLKGIAAQGW